MENMRPKTGMKTGFARIATAGSAILSHLLYFVILSVLRTTYGSVCRPVFGSTFGSVFLTMFGSTFGPVCGSIFGFVFKSTFGPVFERLRAVGRFMRYPREWRTARTSIPLLPTLCLALALVLINGSGAMAQGEACTGNPDFDPPSCINMDPVANAGADRTVNSGAMVTLDGSGSTDPDGNDTIEKYEWTQPGQPAGWTGSPVSRVILTDDNTEMPTFTADSLDAADAIAEVSHYFQLKVTDNGGETHTDTVTITVNAPPLAKIKGLAERRVNSGAMVTLDGSDSDDRPSGDVSYEWERTGGTTGITAPVLTDTTSEMLEFTADSLDPGAAERTHEYTLTVTEVGITGRDPQSNAAIVTITVNAPPEANAGGDQTINAAETAGTVTATLNGSASTDTDGGTLEYSWERTGGTSMSVPSLTGETSNTLTFPVDTLVPGKNDVTHEYRLTVTDAEGLTDTDTVTITINALPVANAGPDRTVPSGTLVTFDGSGSSDTGETLDYFWEGPSGTSTRTADLTGARTENPSYTAMDSTATQAVPKTNIWRLTVTDDNGATATDLVTITIEEAIAAPVARVDDGSPLRIVNPGDMAQQLASTGTVDRRRTISSYNWVRTGGTGTAGDLTLTGTNMAMATFGVAANKPAPGNDDETHEITLTVTDSARDTDTAMVTITVQADPLANAGADRRIQSGTMTSPVTVTLDSSGSRVGAGRTIVSRDWERLVNDPRDTADDLPVGYPAPKAGDSSMATFTAQTLGPGDAEVGYVFELIVEDSSGNIATDRVEITVYSQNALPVATVTPLEITVDSGDPVSLGGTATDSDGTIASWAWTRTSGSGQANIPLTRTATGENTATLNLTLGFIAEQLDAGGSDVTHVFTLVATDNDNAQSAPVVATVTVQAPPLANAGPDQPEPGRPPIVSGATVTLDGSGSRVDSDRTIASWDWTRPDGAAGGTADALPPDGQTGGLMGGTTAMPSFTAQTLMPGDPDVTYILTLTVTDNRGETSTDDVRITVTSPNQIPVANAGSDRSVASGAMVQLDGRGSMDPDDDGEIVSYRWTRKSGAAGGTADALPPNGQTGGLINANTATPGFTAQKLEPGDTDVTYILELVVTDNENAMSEPDTVIITVTAVLVDIETNPSELTVQEGSSGVYQVKLGQSPGQEVELRAYSDHEDVILENTRLVFNTENWNTWQDVKLVTVADADTENDMATIRHTLVTEGIAAGRSGEVRVTIRDEDPILHHIGTYLETRAITLLNNQPELIRFLRQDETAPDSTGELAFRATDGHLALDGGFVHESVWGEITGSHANSDSGDMKVTTGSFGFHRNYSGNFLGGVLLQFDFVDHDLNENKGTIDGSGWMFGPYLVARHDNWPLYFEGRLLYGQSDNRVRFNDPDFRTRTGSFDTHRTLAQLRMEGDIPVPGGNEALRLIPYADGRWVKDRAAAFTTGSETGSGMISVSGQKVSVGELELGSGVEVPIAMRHGDMIVTGGLGLVYSRTKGDYIGSESGNRGRGEIGFSYDVDDALRIDFDSFYDGIGASRYEGYGMSLNARIRF